VIPARLIRTLPNLSTPTVEAWWRGFGELHQGWETVTYRDPLDPRQFPLTADAWPRCTNGAQLAGLVRLEVLWHHGGVYVDSDVECLRPFTPLLGAAAFAGWEDPRVVPDAVLGAEAEHPAIGQCIELALQRLELGAWESGPGVTTEVLPGRPDVLLLPPGAFYPYHYTRKEQDRRRDHASEQPWAFAAHHWHASWVPPKARPVRPVLR
jgi:hypothetical protein